MTDYRPTKPPARVRRVQKYTALIYNDNQAVCSAFVAKDGQGRSYVWTAGHCCQRGLAYRTRTEQKPATRIEYEYQGRRYFSAPLKLADICPTGTDICRLPGTRNRHKTKLQIRGNLPLRKFKKGKDTVQEYDRWLYSVSPFPAYPNGAVWKRHGYRATEGKTATVAITEDELLIQPIFRVGVHELNFRITVFTALFQPGMSGSPIVTDQGVVVGVLKAYRFDSSWPLGHGAMFNTSGLD